MKQKYLLVTTADERTWENDRPMLFLGEWSRLFHRKDQWNHEVNKVHSYHWDDREKYQKDYIYLSDLYERKLKFLVSALNQIHGISESLRYWRIIIGPWLRFFTDALFDRYEIVRTVMERDDFEDTIILQYFLDEWCPDDFKDFYSDFTTDAWNHIVFAEIMKIMKVDNIAFRSGKELLKTKQPLQTRSLKEKLVLLISNLVPSSLNRIVIVSLNVSSQLIFKLQRSLGQIPYFFHENILLPYRGINKKKRLRLSDISCESRFEEILDRLIIYMMPKAYMENFEDWRIKSKNSFPSSPKAILTGNAFQADEGFKFWTAHKTTHGIPLIISQHGGNMGIAKFNQSEDHQKLIADYFVNWGWKDASVSVVSLPALQLCKPKPVCDISGDIIFIVASYPRYFYCQYSIPIAGQFVTYLNSVIAFANSLNTVIRDKVKIRVVDDIFEWRIAQRFQLIGYEKAIENGSVPLFERLNQCSLCVCTYNATVFLETLTSNFPTIIYLHEKYFEVRQEAQEWLELLKTAGILYDSYEEAAFFLNQNGNNLLEWWESKELQEARQKFCSKYAQVSPDCINKWVNFLKTLN